MALALLLNLSSAVFAQATGTNRVATTTTTTAAADTTSAKSKVKVNVRGTVFENTTLKPMADATVKLLDLTGKLVSGAVTRENGQYVLPNIPAGSYTMNISFMGYKEQSFKLNLPEKSGNFKVSDVLMRENTTVLAEAVVEGQLAEMTVVDDTVVYNADAFKLPEGSMVEDLIKKLPGIEQDDDGGYTFNGKQISQVLVDGREFFGRNMDMTLKNLPSDIIKNVKAYDRKSDRTRITGIDDGEERTVLDLTVKPDKKKGWFGNLEGAYGTADRYSGRSNVNHFRGLEKYSLVGNVGNNGGNGLTDRQSAGFTMNYEVPWKPQTPEMRDNPKLRLNGSVNTNFNQGESESSNSTQSFVNTSSAFSNGHNENSNYGRSISFNYGVEWRPDSLSIVQIKPSLNWNKNGSSSSNENATFRSDPYEVDGVTDPLSQIDLIPKEERVNMRIGRSHSSSSNVSGSLSMEFTRKFMKPGRNITLNINENLGNNSSDGDNFSRVDYYRLIAMDGGDSIYHKAQYDNSSNLDNTVSAGISYSEPIADRLYLQFSYNYSYNYRDNDRTVKTIFDPYNELWGVDYDNYRSYSGMAPADTAQCNYTTYKYQNHRANLQFNLNRTQYRLSAGVQVNPQVNEVNYTKGFKHYEVKKNVVNASPTLNFRYRFSRQEDVDMSYRANTGQPGLTDLIPDTVSNADPLNIRLGNPGLKPSFTQTISANYRRSVPTLQRSVSLNGSFRTTTNSVSTMTQYDDETGGRVSRPENINGNWNGNVGFNFNTAFRRNTHYHFNSNTRSDLTNSVSYVYNSREKETKKNRTRSLNLNESMRFSYRNDWLDVNVNGSVRYHHSNSTNTAATNLDTYNFNYGGGFQIQTPWGMTFNSSINESSRRGYSDASMNTNELIWDFSVSQRLLRRRNLVISLRAVDVLNERADVNRNVSSTARVDTSTRNIHSYYMLSLNYRFNKFGGRSSRNRGGEGGGEGGRGGMDSGRGGMDGGRGGFGGGGRGGFGGGGGGAGRF